MKEKLKRLNLEIKESLHYEVKKWAAIRNITMSLYVESILSEQIIRENHFQEKSGKSE